MPLPPHFLARAIPGIGVAVTAGYVGYKLFEHFSKQQETEENDEAIALRLFQEETRSGKTLEEQQDNERAQLCRWLGLNDPDALDEVPTERLAQCLEALSYLPVSARPAFINVMVHNETLAGNDANPSHWLVLTEHLTDDAKEQAVVLLSQLASGNPTAAFVRALEVCPTEQRPMFLQQLYNWFLQHHCQTRLLDVILWQLERCGENDSQRYHLVEAIVQLKEMEDEEQQNETEQGNDTVKLGQAEQIEEDFDKDEDEDFDKDENEAAAPDFTSADDAIMATSSVASSSAVPEIPPNVYFVEVLARLPDPVHVTGFLRGWQLCGQQLPVLSSDDLNATSCSSWVAKLHSLSNERLQQITACLARFPEEAGRNMIRTLLLKDKDNNTNQALAKSKDSSSVVGSCVVVEANSKVVVEEQRMKQQPQQKPEEEKKE